ncbi:TIGR02680 family protein [Streptomyces violaceusniger]|uniref:TIGR02680 family protein n=1 Tax=Streptomyces violaceusniger TaxID=68280 RepID=UPI0036A7F8AF
MTPSETAVTDPALQQLLDGGLPIPERQRFQPLRMGLLGIWEYDEQVFFFYGGKLILRGHNGSGKTKALEVTSPLLLDGILSARRMDPFGNAARSMRDNVLYRGHAQRISYVWTEYGRVTESGEFEYLTVGIGVHALASGKQALRDKWFFTTSQRVGADFSLYDDDRRPRNRAQLEEVLGKEDVHERAKHYREALATRLFGFSSSRLLALVDLLLTLRRPKLSEDLTVAKLSQLLRDGLPPVSSLVLEDLAGKFDELAREREELRALVRNKGHVDTFLPFYGQLARRIVRNEAEGLVATGAQRSTAHRTQRAKADELAGARDQVRQLGTERQRLQLHTNTLQTRVNELNNSPEMEQRGLITELQKQVTAAEELLRKANARHEEAVEGRDKAAGEDEVEQGELEMALQQLSAADQWADKCAAVTALEVVHRDQREVIRHIPETARDTLMGHVNSRTEILSRAAKLAEGVAEAHRKHDSAAELCSRLGERLDTAKQTCDGHEENLAQRIRELRAFLVEWSEQCRQLRLTEDQLGDLLAAVPVLGKDAAITLAELVAAEARHVEGALNATLAEQKASRKGLQAKHRELTAERARVSAEEDALPPAPLTPRRSRTADLGDGAPLWKLLEFAPTVTDQQAAQLEAALLGAGLLDAWVTTDGRALSRDTLETVLIALDEREAPAPSVIDVILPVEHPLVPAAVTRRILGSIALDDQDTTHPHAMRVGMDGTWRIGAVHGRTTGTAAAYIGATARAAERKRRLEALDLQLHALDASITELDSQITGTRGRLDQLDTECAETRDKDRTVREARHALDGARALLSGLELEIQQAQTNKHALWEQWQDAERQLDDYARPRGVRPDHAAILQEQQSLARYANSVTSLFHAAKEHLARSKSARRSGQRLIDTSAQLQKRVQELAEAQIDLEDRKEQLKVRTELVGADVDKVLADLAAATKKLSAAKDALEDNHSKSTQISEKVGTLVGAVDAATKECTALDEKYESTVKNYRRLGEYGYLELAGVYAAGTDGLTEVEAQARAAVSQLADELWTEAALNEARTDTDTQFRLLQSELDGPDWRPRATYDGTLFLVTLLHNGENRSVPDAQDIMANEIHTRRSYLSDEEHGLFTEVLLGRLGDHLRRRRARAKSLIEHMNTLLQQVPTSSGHLMKLIWEPDPSQDQDVLDALDSLDGQSSEHLSEDAREQLIRFLVERVETARDNESGADWRTHLREALDYRAWSRIRIRHKAGPDQSWTNLTDQKQQRGSGGEQAVALQLPLFVAAAAHYQGAAATAPRPIYLDEAFAGIDTKMRGRCMGLLTQLDLDVVLASHDEWGFHQEVPKVATYQLFRHSGLPGVLTTPILWDGAERHVLPDPALRQDTAFDMGLDWDDEEDLLDEEFAEDEETEAENDDYTFGEEDAADDEKG